MISAGIPTEYVPYGKELLPLHPQDTGFDSSQQASSWLCPETDSSRDLFRAFKAVSLTDERPRERWTLRLCDGGEEELYFSQNTIIWSLSDGHGTSSLLKTFSLENPVHDAVWCDFNNDDDGISKVSCICAHDNTTLEIFSDEGDTYPVTLPFQVSKMHSTKNGLLFERAPANVETQQAASSLPLLFSMSHPLKDICPVILKHCSKLSQKATYLTLESKYKLVGICREWSIAVLHCKADGTHSAWCLRTANEDDTAAVNIPSSRMGEFGASWTAADSPISQNWQQNQSTMSPLSSLNHTKQNSMISSPSLMKTQSRSISMSSVTGCLSPLRSSRLAAAPASPLLRAFNSPNTSFGSPIPSSPQTLTRRLSGFGSPFSRLSATPAATEYDFSDEISEPIIPELCFDFMWCETSQSSSGQASKVFTTTDFLGQTYLAYLMYQPQQLRLIRFDRSNDGQRLIFGALNVISAKDAEPLSSKNLIVTLDLSGNLILYSGIYKISTVHLPSLTDLNCQLTTPAKNRKSSLPIMHSSFNRGSLLSSSRPTSSLGSFPKFSLESRIFSPVVGEHDFSRIIGNQSLRSSAARSVTNITALQSGVGSRVTVENAKAKLFRFDVPSITSSDVVKQCLSALKAVLPKDMSMHLMIKWYCTRNAPGRSEFTDEEEIEMFKKCLLTLVGYELEDLNNSSLNDSMGSLLQSKKLKLDADDACGTSEDWEWMQENVLDGSNEHPNLTRSPNGLTASTPLFPYIPYMLYALHLTYEELKLRTMSWEFAPKLLDVLFLFATDLRLIAYQDHYWRDFPEVCSQLNSVSLISESSIRNLLYPSFFTESPPSIYQFLQSLLTANNYTQVSAFPYIPNTTQNIRRCILLFASIRNEKFADKDFLLPVQTHGQKHQSEEFSIDGPSKREERLVAVMNRLGVTQNELHSLPVSISFPFWESILTCRKDPSPHRNLEWYTLVGRLDLVDNKPGSHSAKFNPHVNTAAEVDDDGIQLLNREVLKLIFADDQRVLEAYNLLQSSKPVKITIQQRPGVTDHDFIEEQERHLYTISIRTMALSVGRGMLTLRTYKPVVAETFPIPKLCLSGRVPPRNTAVELTHIDVPANMNTWPLFHNGVAAGLRASPSASEIIDSSWIVYNRPKSTASLANEALNEHAGFLLALGLNGHLSKLSMMNIHDYLCKGNELTRVAVLLGLAAARRGTMDQSAIKVLSIHVEALLPPTSTELDVPPVVQVAAVLGVGLLYQSSGQRHIAEVLLGEIGRPPGPEMEHYIDRESYALAAGLAFGLVMLGKGNEIVSLVSSAESVSMADQLCNYMIGGHKKPLTTVQREKYKTPSYQIREGDYVNADVTSPGATLALGMLFFNSNSEAVSKWVTAPDTQHLLETVRPDFLLLRTLAKGLVMWSKVTPSKEWVDTHIPVVVSANAFQRQEDYNPRIDYETMSQAYCNIVAGACMTLGLKFAGTANKNAFKVVMSYTRMFLALPNRPQHADQAGRSTIESCLNVLIISLALIMAGTGNLEVFKICRYLRSRTSQVNVVLYGSHMATHMALGLLFLGGCRYTISTAPEAIASLLCAFFPKFPIHSNDNRYHLQAFRHLYVLAVEPRLVIPRDVDSGHLVYVHLQVKYKSTGLEETLRAPCLIPELNLLDEVVIDDPRYWKITFKRGINWEHLRNFLQYSGIMDVKQKVGCLSYRDDPKGYKSVHSQYAMKDAVKGWGYKPQSVSAFSNDTVTVNFSELVLAPGASSKLERQLQQLFCAALMDCASQETMDCLPALIELNKYSRRRSEACNSFVLWQVKLAISVSPYCSSLKDHFIEGLKAFVAKKVTEAEPTEIIKYLKGEITLKEVGSSSAEALLVCDMPPYASLSPLQERIMSFPDLVSNLRHFSLPVSTLVLLSESLNKFHN